MARHRLASLALCALTLVSAVVPAAAQGALDPHTEKIKRDVARIGTPAEISVLREGDDYHGVVTKIDVDTFDVADVDYHRTITVRYAEVQKVRSGYDGVNLFTGKHTSHSRGLKIGAIAVGAFLAVGLPLVLLAASED